MKAEKENPGLIRRLAAVLTRNWGLKLLALILALFVYYSLKNDSSTSSRTDNDRKIFHRR